MYIVVLHIYEIPKGQPGDKFGRAGRLALVEDASGGEAYYYGRQGEVTKTVRTVMASVADIRTYVYGATYDSWNRVRTMTYLDCEVVTYHYNAAGQVESLTSSKLGKESTIVAQIGYDKDGHTVYQKLGNGTETTYTYDKQRERLQDMTLTGSGSTLMQNKYRYDAVDNILGITNAANPQGLTKLNKAKLGGASTHTYQYDELNRLIHATGKAKSATYDMAMTFGRMSEPLTKVQRVDSSLTAKSYNFAYKYEDESHPTAPTQIGHDHYTYDANGNPTLVTNDSTNTTREMYWDEDNRLMVLLDNGKTSRYTYNAGGERIMKSYGTMEGVYINGAPQGITFHETDNFTLYPASILTVNKNRFTKHYFIGSQRIASRIGTGTFNNVYGINGSYVTAGQQDYAERMNQIQSQKEAYYKELGIAPGVPTEKGAYGDPENTGVGYNSVLTELGNHDVPQGWVQTPKHNDEQGSTPGTPISWNDPSNPDDPQAGYGYVPNDITTEETFFFHSDHLGSISYITDDKGNITQYDAYLPYGELLVDEHSSSEEMPYKFNGKEFDDETGLYYYGARYMDPVASIWYGVDPLKVMFVKISPYTVCHNNPIGFKDLNGMYDKEGAQKAAQQYGAEYHMDSHSGKWFVSLDETGTKAYTTGGSMTRDFGPSDNILLKGYPRPSFEADFDYPTFVVGTGLGVSEQIQYSTYFNTWMGKNFKIYHGLSGRGPNQFTGSRAKALQKGSLLSKGSKLLTGYSIYSTYKEYNEKMNSSIGPNLRRYYTNRYHREQLYNFSGEFNIYGAAFSLGYSFGGLIENLFNINIQYNPYTNDFTPIEETLWDADRRGEIIYY